MPLVSLKTELKNLKYGRDRKGGGSSNQPYIKTSIPEQQLYSPKGLPPTPPDFLLRNGFLTPLNAANDVSRLTQFLFDTKSINGYFFITKQNLQSRISVKTEASRGSGHLGGALNQGVYLPTSTLAQSQIVYLGGHLNLFGLNPIKDAPGSIGRYENTINTEQSKEADKSEQSKRNNRLIALKELKFDKSYSEIISPNPLFKYGASEDNILFKYTGGPNSNLGLGETIIRQSSYKTGEANNQIKTTFFDFKENKIQRFNVFKRDTLWNKSNLLTLDKPGYPLGASNKFFKSKSIFNVNEYTPSSIEENGGLTISSDSGSFQNNNISEKVENTVYNIEKEKKSFNPAISKFVPYSYFNQLFNYKGTLLSRKKDIKLKFYTNPLGASNKYNLYLNPSNSGSLDIENYYKNENGIERSPYILKQGSVYSITPDENGKDKRKTNNDVAGKNNTYYTPLEKLDEIAKDTQDNKETHERKIINFINKNKTNDRTNLLTSASINQEYNSGSIIDSKYDMGNPGSLTRKSGEEIKTTSLDEINSDNGIVDDIINFKIHHIEGKTIQFRAFLENFSDNYTANWNSYKYVGRADNFYTYESFDRQIALSFNVYAQSYNELPYIHGKLNYLASLTAPKYTEQGFMKGNIIKLTVGNYLQNVPGILKGVNYDINLESWDVDKDRKMPHLVKVNTFSFTPIHDFLPEVGKNFISWGGKK